MCLVQNSEGIAPGLVTIEEQVGSRSHELPSAILGLFTINEKAFRTDLRIYGQAYEPTDGRTDR